MSWVSLLHFLLNESKVIIKVYLDGRIEDGGKIVKLEDGKKFSFSSSVFNRDDGKVG